MAYRPEELVEYVEKMYLGELRKCVSLKFNPNVKGQGIELAVKDFMEMYLGSIFDFYNRVALVDAGGMYYRTFSPAENEFDVVATYKTAVPRVVIETEAIKYVPLDAVAFVIETKHSLTRRNLELGLRKFSKLLKLPLSLIHI